MSETVLHWWLEFSKSQTVLEGKETVLISNIFMLFIMMLVEELLGKVMNVLVDTSLIGGCVALVRGWFLLLF